MYKFNNDNIIVGLIKEKLHDFNLPCCHIYNSDSVIIKNNIYIYNSILYKALVNSKEDSTSITGYNNTPINSKNFKKLNMYKRNDMIINLTKNMIINNHNYDSYTHQYLGDYLRFVRDYDHINLMSMYNCFANTYAKNLSYDLVINTNIIKFNDFSDKFKIFMVPVKFQQKYTIAIDCDVPFEIMAGFYNNGQINSETIIFEYKNTYQKIGSSYFNKPFIYDKLINLSKLIKLEGKTASSTYNQEENLKLFIKVPSTNKSALVVLEGDYSKNKQTTFINNFKQLPHYIFQKQFDKNNNQINNRPNYSYYSKLQLLNINSGVSYPFADKLIQYLFGNVINPNDEIKSNIIKIQNKMQDLTTKKIYNFNYIKEYDGIWDNQLRNCLYEYCWNTNLVNTEFDVIGFVDKELENQWGDYDYGQDNLNLEE